MSTKIINLNLSAVRHEAAVVLESYPHHPYQQAFSIPALRQQLVSFVMNHLPAHFEVMDETETDTIDWNHNPVLAEQRAYIDEILRQGIERVLQDNADWIKTHIPTSVSAGLSSSTWFG
jgi:hypothetical protein